MPLEELVNIRQKYKGAYDDLSDGDLAGMLAAKYPAYKDLPDRVAQETKPVFGAIGADVIKRAFEPAPPTTLPPTPTTSRLNPGGLTTEQVARGIGEVGQKITPFPGLVGALSGIKKSGTLPELVNPMPEVVTSAFSSVLEAIRRRDPSLAKDVEAVMAVAPFHGPPVGSIKPALQAARSVLPFSRSTPAAPTVNDLIARERPPAPTPSMAPGVPAAAAEAAPKRTIVDLVDEIKADIKEKVIAEIADELKAGLTAAKPPAQAPKLLAPPETPPTVAPGATIEPPARVTSQPIAEVPPAVAQAPARAKFTETTPIEQVLPPRVATAPAAPKKILADSKIRQLVNVDGPLEYKGKTYTGAIREGKDVRLKDNPDKVLKKADEILQVEEKVPFDIPPAQAAPFDRTRLKAAVQLDDGEIVSGAAGRGGHAQVYEALSPAQQQRVKATGWVDPTDPNAKNFYPDSAAAERAHNVRAGIETPAPAAPTRKVKGPNGELVEVPAEPPDIAMTKKAAPTFQQTPAGKQAVIPGAEGREVPLTPLRPKRAQTEKPLELEMPAIRAKEPELLPGEYSRRSGELSRTQPVENIGDRKFTSEKSPDRPRPTPESQLSPEEIAARDEMRGMLGGKKPRGLTGIIKSEKGQIELPGREPLPDDPTVSKGRLVAGGIGEESSKTLSKKMGPEGAELARLSKAVRNDSEIEAHTAATAVNKTLKGLDKNQLDNLVDVLEGKARPVDSDVRAAFTTARRELDKAGARAESVGLEITNPVTGEKYPFQRRKNHYPHMFEKELGEYVKDPAARVDIKRQIKAQMEAGGKEVTDKQVEQALTAMLKAAKGREGHLELARIFNRPDYSRDVGVVLNRYFEHAYRRINIAEKFKPDLSKGEELLTAIGQRTNSDFAEEFARKYFQRVTGTEPVNRLAHEAVNTAVNLNNFSLLGQASIANASQPVYTAILAGAKRTAQGYAKAMTAEGREFASKILGNSAREFMEDIAAAQGSSTSGKLADFVLKYTGFNFTERMNRIVAANAGRVYAQDTFAKLLKNPAHKGLRETLERMNVDVDAALKRGALTELDELKAGQNIVNRTQFKTDVTELPLFWSSESGRLLTQYKKFQFKSGQFVKDEILKEIAKGNIMPLARAAAIAPVAGYAVAKARDAIRFGKQTEQDRGLADYLAVVGTFGAFTDAFAGSGRQPVRGLQYLAGPTLGRAGQLWEGVTAIPREGNVRPLAKFGASSVPVVGPSIRQLFNEPAKTERQKFAEELGLERESMSRQKMKKQLGLTR